MGTSLDSHIKWTAGCIPARLNYYLDVEDAESSIRGLLALVQPFATGPVLMTAGMVIVDVRHQSPMQLLQDGSHCRKPLFGVGILYIILISVIQEAVHFHPVTPQPATMQRYMSNTIDLDAWNLFYM